MFLGMDFGASDFGYFTALLNSLILDIQTIQANGSAAYTVNQKNLLNDKAILCNDAMKKTAAASTASMAQKTSLSDKYANAATLKAAVDTMTPAGGDGTAAFGDYRPGKVFCLPPVLPPAAYLYPSPEAASQMAIVRLSLPLTKGSVTPVISVDEKGNITTNYTPGGVNVVAPVAEQKIPTIAIIAAVVGGLYLMTR